MENTTIIVEEENQSAPKPRGRQKGTKIGPRPTVWICAGIVDGELIHESFSSNEEEGDGVAKFSEQDAKNAFEDAHGIEPENILGPFMERRGGQTAPVKKRETVNIVAPKLTSNRKTAIFRGWKGIAYGIEDRDDVSFFIYSEPLNNKDIKKTIPSAKAIFNKALEFVGDNTLSS